MNLLKKHRVTAFLCGHRHRFGWTVVDGIPHVLADGVAWDFTGMGRRDVIAGRTMLIHHVYADRLVVGFRPMHSPIYARLLFPIRPRSHPRRSETTPTPN